MAKVLKRYEFNRSTAGGDYPWDEWADGRIWKLIRGEDFECKPLSFRGAAYREAKRRKMNVRSEILAAENAIVIQFVEGE